MKSAISRRVSTAAVLSAVTLAGGLALAGPANAAPQKVGGVGCTTKGVTILDSGRGSLACYAGTAGTLSGQKIFYSAGVKSVVNHGWAGYLPGNSTTELRQAYLANGLEYQYQDAHSLTIEITINN